MDNYKIKVNNGLDIHKVKTALKALSYELGEMPCDGILHVIYAISDKSVRYVTYDDGYDYHGIEAKDLTIPQLEDLVVLKQNDVNDATHEDKYNGDKYRKDTNGWHGFVGGKWVEGHVIEAKLIPVNQKEDLALHNNTTTDFKTLKVEGFEGLIDGKAALAAALNGEEIQMTFQPWESSWQSFNPEVDEVSTKAFWTDLDSEGQKLFFRIKPNKFLINGIEVPAPLTKEPMGKIPYYYLRPDWEKGYCQTTWEDIPIDKKRFSNGIWPTESAIRQVVAAFRKTIQVL